VPIEAAKRNICSFFRWLQVHAEARYFLHLSRRLGYVGDGDYSKASKLAEETSKTLSGLIHALKREV